MLIQFRCGNYSRFDEKTGQHEVCGQQMEADRGDVGLIVTCPRCGTDCEVPAAKKSRSDAAMAPAVRGNLKRCQKCGGNLDAKGSCTKCNWIRPRFDKSKMSLDEMPMEPAGMTLWFFDIMSEAIPMRAMTIILNIVVPFLTVSAMVFSLVLFGGFVGGLLFLIAFLALLFYVGLAFKGYQFLTDGNAQLAWFQKPIWNGILAWCRSKKWQGLDNSARDRNVLIFRNESITDQELAVMKGLKNVQVLDLEGTLITDEGIKQLYQCRHLQCLVVRNTKVSHLAVTRLQQSFPKLWIWS